MSKPILVARIFSDDGEYRTFTSSLVKLGVTFSFITAESTETKPEFVTFDHELSKLQAGINSLMIEASMTREEAAEGDINKLDMVKWRMTGKEPAFSEAEKFVHSAKVLRRKVAKLEESEGLVNNSIEAIQRIIKASGAKGLWAQNTAVSQGDAEFKLYPLEDLSRLLKLELEAIS